MSQNELADALQQQPSAISRILGNDEQNLTLKTIAKLEAYFGEEIIQIKGRETPVYKKFKMNTSKSIIKTSPVHITSRKKVLHTVYSSSRFSDNQDNQPSSKAV